MRDAVLPVMRTLQFFLSDDGVHEVVVPYEGGDEDALRCDCMSFGARSNCRHVSLVRSRMRLNGGGYPVDIKHSGVTQEQLSEIAKDPAKFREFVIMHAKVEYL